MHYVETSTRGYVVSNGTASDATNSYVCQMAEELVAMYNHLHPTDADRERKRRNCAKGFVRWWRILHGCEWWTWSLRDDEPGEADRQCRAVHRPRGRGRQWTGVNFRRAVT